MKDLLDLDFWFLVLLAGTSLVGLVEILNSPHEWVKAAVALVTVLLLVDKFLPRVLPSHKKPSFQD